jgi:hypothetical protein
MADGCCSCTIWSVPAAHSLCKWTVNNLAEVASCCYGSEVLVLVLQATAASKALNVSHVLGTACKCGE